MRPSRLWPLAFLVVLVQPAEAQESLTLQQALNQALLHNPSYQQAVNTYSASGAEIWEAVGNFLPTVTFNGGISDADFTTRNFITPEGVAIRLPDTLVVKSTRRNTNGSLSLNLTLLDGGRNIFTLLKAKKTRRSADYALDAAGLNTTLEVKRIYYGVLKAQKLLEFQEKQLQQREQELKLAQTRFEVGSVTQSDVLQAKINRGRQEIEIINARNTLIQTKLALNAAMGVELEQDYRLVEEFPIFEPRYQLDELIQYALERHPDINRLETQEDVDRHDLRIAKASYLPTLSLSALFQRNENYPGNVDFIFNPQNTLGAYQFTLSWNIFDGFSRLNQNAQAKARLLNTQESLRDTRLRVERMARDRYLNLLRYYQVYLTNQDNVTLAEQELELAQRRYALGSNSFIDLLDSQVSHTRAQTDFINALFDFHIALAELEAAVGRDLRP